MRHDDNPMSLCRMVYISEATAPMTGPSLQQLVSGCSQRNRQKGISGLLLHAAGNFIQVLEGDVIKVPALFAKIVNDARHKNVRLLQQEMIDNRLFPDWGMQLATPQQAKSIDQAALDKALIRLRLSKDHDSVSGRHAIALLQEFRRQLMNDAA